MNLQSTHSEKESPEFTLKPLSKDGVAAAVAKAEKYRLLNDPIMAESICLDILKVAAGHKEAELILLLALTDQFGVGGAPHVAKKARDLVESFKDDYLRLYYSGLIHERQGTATLNSGSPGRDCDAYEWYHDAMDLYEKAEKVHPPDNDDAILRWNTCARIIMRHHLTRRPPDDSVTLLE